MTHKFPRLIVSIVLLTSALLVALVTPSSATAAPDAGTHSGASSSTAPEDDMGPPPATRAAAATPATASGSGEYTPVEWLPLRGSVDIGCSYMSSGPYCNGGHHGYHAIDMGGTLDQPVYAAGGGIATVYDTSRGCSGYGVTVKVDHGPYGSTIYAHLDDVAPAVKDAAGGLWVDENTVIGYVGHTGSISDCALNHLHFEYWVGGVWESGSVRSPTPDLKGCVGNELRTYPDYFGHDTWQYLPGHEFTAVSDGTGCTGGPKGELQAAAGTLGGFAQLRGWTFDPDEPTASTQVHVYVDGPAGSGAAGTVLVANRSRPDVAWSFPGAGYAHGFHNAIGGLAPGNHQLYVYAINLADTPGEHTVLGTPTITVPSPQAGMPTGSFDSASGLVNGQAHVTGWAFDPDVPTTSTQVQVYIDGPSTSGVPSVTIDANVARPDVGNAFPGVGPLHGFDATISDIEPGVRNLWIYAVNASGAAGNPLLGVRSVTVVGDPSLCVDGSQAGPFTDVSPTNPFCRDIEWMNVESVDGGLGDDSYGPGLPNTRGMMASQLYNFAGEPAFTPPAVSPFSDVTTSHPLYKQITWLASTGITTGYDDGTFKPDSPVSRQAMAAFFYRDAGEPTVSPVGGGVALPYSDITSLHPFFDEIAWLTTSGIAKGYADGTFKPTAPITRQAMAALLHRYAAT